MTTNEVNLPHYQGVGAPEDVAFDPLAWSNKSTQMYTNVREKKKKKTGRKRLS